MRSCESRTMALASRRKPLPRIFEMFAQAEAPNGPHSAGLGIGLAIVKDVVELHGGSVQVRSDGPGKGSEFTVGLPLMDVSAR
jgi:signal transduction histidine kinase